VYDSGAAAPARPARSTFLVLNDRTYPAKFIRGLAYRLATGVELDASRDYAGGLETARFFDGLGFVTRLDPSTDQSPAPTRTPATLPQPDRQTAYLTDTVRKIALVSHDYNVTDGGGRDDYSEHFGRINRVCDGQGCDTILYALYTWDLRSPVPRTGATMFGGLAYVWRIVLELYEPPYRGDHVEVWRRGHDAPLVATQRFATATAPGHQKQGFLDDLPQRQIGDSLLVLCGESNIASLIRGSDEFSDPYRFADRLTEMGVRVVLNPIHDYMRRYEMREKRRYYSLGGRTVVSVWNRGAGKEAHLPWTVFHDGEEYTAAVRELDPSWDDRPDIRIGVLDLDPFRGEAGG
jgi:hypothetical protein